MRCLAYFLPEKARTQRNKKGKNPANNKGEPHYFIEYVIKKPVRQFASAFLYFIYLVPFVLMLSDFPLRPPRSGC
jgi:hypothetical protein